MEGERRLAELLEDRALALGFQCVLYELLLDRGGALYAAAADHVVQDRTAERAQVHAFVAVEALVLDRDHRVLDDPGDLFGGQQDLVAPAQHRKQMSAVVDEHGVVGVAVLHLVFEPCRSEVTAMNMPNTKEMPPSTRTANRIASSRTHLMRGRERRRACQA